MIDRKYKKYQKDYIKRDDYFKGMHHIDENNNLKINTISTLDLHKILSKTYGYLPQSLSRKYLVKLWLKAGNYMWASYYFKDIPFDVSERKLEKLIKIGKYLTECNRTGEIPNWNFEGIVGGIIITLQGAGAVTLLLTMITACVYGGYYYERGRSHFNFYETTENKKADRLVEMLKQNDFKRVQIGVSDGWKDKYGVKKYAEGELLHYQRTNKIFCTETNFYDESEDKDVKIRNYDQLKKLKSVDPSFTSFPDTSRMTKIDHTYSMGRTPVEWDFLAFVGNGKYDVIEYNCWELTEISESADNVEIPPIVINIRTKYYPNGVPIKTAITKKTITNRFDFYKNSKKGFKTALREVNDEITKLKTTITTEVNQQIALLEEEKNNIRKIIALINEVAVGESSK